MTGLITREECVRERQFQMGEHLRGLEAVHGPLVTGRTKGGFQTQSKYIEPIVSERRAQKGTGSIAIVTQCTPDRFHSVGEIARAWSGPVSVSVYIKDLEEMKAIKAIMAADIHLTRYVTVHLLYSVSSPYPVNSLRNLAILNADSDYVLLMDVDFRPSQPMKYFAHRISHSNDQVSRQKNRGKEMYVVPALQSRSTSLPKLAYKKEELMELMEDGTLTASNLCACYGCHAPTDLGRWKAEGARYPVKYQWFYEPFLLAERASLELYDERFQGYANDKVSHTFANVLSGAVLYTLPDVAIIHMAHAHSRENRGSWEGAHCVDRDEESGYIHREIHKLVCDFLTEKRQSRPKGTVVKLLGAPSEHFCWMGRCKSDVRVKLEIDQSWFITLQSFIEQPLGELAKQIENILASGLDITAWHPRSKSWERMDQLALHDIITPLWGQSEVMIAPIDTRLFLGPADANQT